MSYCSEKSAILTTILCSILSAYEKMRLTNKNGIERSAQVMFGGQGEVIARSVNAIQY